MKDLKKIFFSTMREYKLQATQDLTALRDKKLS